MSLAGSSRESPETELITENDSSTTLKGTKHIRGPSWTHPLILTSVFLGNQSIWSAEMAYGKTSPVHLSWFINNKRQPRHFCAR